jgi:hypothetical protein
MQSIFFCIPHRFVFYSDLCVGGEAVPLIAWAPAAPWTVAMIVDGFHAVRASPAPQPQPKRQRRRRLVAAPKGPLQEAAIGTLPQSVGAWSRRRPSTIRAATEQEVPAEGAPAGLAL